MAHRIEQYLDAVKERTLLALGALSERAFDRVCHALVNPMKYFLIVMCLVSLGRAIELYVLLNDELIAVEERARGLQEYTIARKYNHLDSSDWRQDEISGTPTPGGSRVQEALAAINAIALESGVHIETVTTSGTCRQTTKLTQSQIQISFRAGFQQVRQLYNRIIGLPGEYSVVSLVVERANSSNYSSTITGSLCLTVVTKSSSLGPKMSRTEHPIKQPL